jgi:hypothetical protein
VEIAGPRGAGRLEGERLEGAAESVVHLQARGPGSASTHRRVSRIPAKEPSAAPAA